MSAAGRHGKLRAVSPARAFPAALLLVFASAALSFTHSTARAEDALPTPVANPSAVAALPTAAREWLATVDNPANPGPVGVPRPFTANYSVRWGNVEAARAEASFTQPNAGELQTRVTAQTVGTARALWQMDATHLEVTRRADLRPLWLEHSETLSAKQNAFRVDFDSAFVTRRHRQGRPGETLTFSAASSMFANERARRFDYPGLRDMVSAFLYLRSQPLAAGEQHTVALMSAKNPYLALARVVGRGEVQVKAGRFPAIELELSLQKIDKDGRLRNYKQFKNARVWLSDDADRLLLRTDTRVFIGHLILELDQVTFPAATAATATN